MATILAAFTVHGPDCDDPCDCEPELVVVEGIFTPGPTLRASVSAARDAAWLAVMEAIAEA